MYMFVGRIDEYHAINQQHMLRFDWISLFKQYLRYNPVIRCVIYYAFGLSAKVGQKCMLLMQRVISSAVLYNKKTRNVSSHKFCCLLKQLNIFAKSKPSASTIFEFWAPWKYRRKMKTLNMQTFICSSSSFMVEG